MIRHDGRLYLGCGNPRGLQLLAGNKCEMHAGTPAPVEVWLGKVMPELIERHLTNEQLVARQ